MDILQIHVFKNSNGPMLALLNEHEINYKIREQRAGKVKASSSVIELSQLATLWGPLASVIINCGKPPAVPGRLPEFDISGII